MGIVENRTCCDAELVFTLCTLKLAVGLKPTYCRVLASGTSNSVRPAQPFKIFSAFFLGGIQPIKLHNSHRSLHEAETSQQKKDGKGAIPPRSSDPKRAASVNSGRLRGESPSRWIGLSRTPPKTPQKVTSSSIICKPNPSNTLCQVNNHSREESPGYWRGRS